MEAITVNAQDLRKGDIVWIHASWWEVRYISQSDHTATVQTNLVSREIASAVLRRDFHPSEQVRRKLRTDDLVYKILYGA